MSLVVRSMAVVLICTAPASPAVAYAGPQLNWQIDTAPHPITLRVALGPSDQRRLRRRSGRSRVHRSEPAGLRATATGWIQPLGLRVALRW